MRGFAVADNREAKAKKIEKVICDYLHSEHLRDKKILDIGAGSGHIAEFFAQHNKIWGVDATTQLKEMAHFFEDFKIVTDEALPFLDNSFDIVISNHVAAYLPNKSLHFEEIYRVLKPGGICYFATPNRNFPLEPHFKMPLLHYFPATWFNFFMRLLGKYKEPVHLLSFQGAIRLATKLQLTHYDYSIPIIRDPQKYYMNGTPLPLAPNFLKWISPTIVLLLVK